MAKRRHNGRTLAREREPVALIRSWPWVATMVWRFRGDDGYRGYAPGVTHLAILFHNRFVTADNHNDIDRRAVLRSGENWFIQGVFMRTKWVFTIVFIFSICVTAFAGTFTASDTLVRVPDQAIG